MNLYQVWDKHCAWSCFVFDVSRNRAKASAAKVFDEDYINIRCVTLRKGISKIQNPKVVDSETDEEYQVVLECGYRYYDDEELTAMIEEWEQESDAFFNKGHPTEKGR